MNNFERLLESKDNSKPIKGEKKYVDYFKKADSWCIFGKKSGYCYGEYDTQSIANNALKKLKTSQGDEYEK